MTNLSLNSFVAVLDEDNHRYVISPLNPNKTITVSAIFRIIKKYTHCPFKTLAEFAGLRSSSDAFKVAYSTREYLTHQLSQYLVIDVDKNEAYFYDHKHKPAGVIPPHIGPSIENNEPEVTITEKIPFKATTRVKIVDTLDRSLTLSITTTNGYILGISDSQACVNGSTYQVSGYAKSLNYLLKHSHFIGYAPGPASITIKVDDRAGHTSSVVSTTVALTVQAGEVISVPTLTVPKNLSVVLNKYTKVPGIEVADTDNKYMELKISPFGCKVVGFKDILEIFEPGQQYIAYGRPGRLNSLIENIQVVAFSTQAALGVELIYEKTKIRDYAIFNVTQKEESGESGESGEPADPTPTESGESGESGEPQETPAPEVTAPSLYVTDTEVIGDQETDIPLGVTVVGTDDQDVTVAIKPIKCSITIDGKTILANNTFNLEGTVAAVNAKLASATLKVGAEDGGKVEITLGDTTQTINIISVESE